MEAGYSFALSHDSTFYEGVCTVAQVTASEDLPVTAERYLLMWRYLLFVYSVLLVNVPVQIKMELSLLLSM